MFKLFVIVLSIQSIGQAASYFEKLSELFEKAEMPELSDFSTTGPMPGQSVAINSPDTLRPTNLVSFQTTASNGSPVTYTQRWTPTSPYEKALARMRESLDWLSPLKEDPVVTNAFVSGEGQSNQNPYLQNLFRRWTLSDGRKILLVWSSSTTTSEGSKEWRAYFFIR